jgi:hypothetical protein
LSLVVDPLEILNVLLRFCSKGKENRFLRGRRDERP